MVTRQIDNKKHSGTAIFFVYPAKTHLEKIRSIV